MSKSRDNKIRRRKASYKLAEWRASHDTAVPVEVVSVKGKLPIKPAK